MAEINLPRRFSPPPTFPPAPEVMQEGEKREDIAVAAESADAADDHVFHERHLPEPLPAGRVREVHLDRRETAEEEGVPDRDAGVGVAGRVDHHSVGRVPGLLERLDDLPLVVGLEELHRGPFAARGKADGLPDGGEGLAPVEAGLPLPQHVEVRAVDEEDPAGPLALHNSSCACRAAWRSRKRHFPGTIPAEATTTRKYSSVTRRTNNSACSPARDTSPADPSPYSAAIRSDSRNIRTISAQRAGRSHRSSGARHSSTVRPSDPTSAP